MKINPVNIKKTQDDQHYQVLSTIVADTKAQNKSAKPIATSINNEAHTVNATEIDRHQQSSEQDMHQEQSNTIKKKRCCGYSPICLLLSLIALTLLGVGIITTLVVVLVVIPKKVTTTPAATVSVTTTPAATVAVTTTPCTSIFPVQVTYSTGSGSAPQYVAVTDVNGDSKPDIIVANNGGNNVGVLLNIGSGTFAAQVTYSTGAGSYPYSLAVADVNADSQPDIIVANHGLTNVGVLLNIGSGTFAAQVTYSTGSGLTSVAAVDVNSDGKPDIIVANTGANSIGVLINTGTGTFVAQVTYSTGAASGPSSVAVADVNADNKPDIIVANNYVNNVGVLINTGTGTFVAQVTYSTGASSQPVSVAVADVNGDNNPDILVANNFGGTAGVLLNTGTGTFVAQVTYSTGSGSYPYSVVAADVNADSQIDMILANENTKNVGVFLNTGSGTFAAQLTYSTGSTSYPLAAVAVDVNADSKPDIIVANNAANNVGVFLAC